MFTITDKKLLPYYQKIEKDFPLKKNLVKAEKDVFIEMRDGIKLITRIFEPDFTDPYEVLFTRNPYPANTKLLEALYVPFVEQGYCLVIQDCRGTGDSEGKWEPFKNEREDGIDSLKWLNQQSWIKSIATFGRSYSAYTQWIVGDKLPDKVKTMFLEVYGVNRFDQVYDNGMFREDIYTSWAFQNSLVKSDIPVGKQYQEAFKIYPAVNRDERILHTRLDFYRDYLTHTKKDDHYWKDSIWNILENIPSKINVPVVVTDGWADHHLQGSLIGYRNLRPEIKDKSHLIITPTDHMSNTTGNLDYPNAGKYGVFNLTANLIWFNHILKGDPKDLSSGCYQMRSGKWINPNDCDNLNELKFYLTDQYSLAKNNNSESTIRFKYDPTHPNNWPGGNELLAWIAPGFTDQPHGFIKTQPYSDRADVVHFETEKMNNGVVIQGDISVQLKVDTDVEDTAFAVRLVEKTQGGEYINIKDGISSLSNNNGQDLGIHQEGKPQIIRIELGDIYWKVQPGSSLVLLVSSSNFPMYSIHSNKFGLWSQQTLEAKIAHQIIYTDEDSFITLQIVKE